MAARSLARAARIEGWAMASESAVSSVEGRVGRRLGGCGLFGTRPTSRWKVCSLMVRAPRACTTEARVLES